MGSRGGVFFCKLRNTNETVKFGMKTLAYHEGVPDITFRIAIQSELQNFTYVLELLFRLPLFRRFGHSIRNTGLGIRILRDDPFGNLGRLQAEMFRAVRLVR